MNKVFLLADDDPDDRGLFCEALEAIDPNITCYYAKDGTEVMKFLDNKELKKPQLIFLDLNMPRMNGWQCLAQLKEHKVYKNIPVLIYSTSTHQRDADIAIDLGALCFFSKPGSFSQLKDILEVVAANINKNLLDAISHFNNIKSKKVFACTDDE